MISVLLFILKMIGFILLGILGLFLISLLAILFVPLRYRLYGEKKKDIKADLKLGWFWRFVYIHVSYDGDKPVIHLRVLGIKLFDSTKPKKPKKNKQKKAKKRKKRSEEIAVDLPAQESNPDIAQLQPFIEITEEESPPILENEANETKRGFRAKLLRILKQVADFVDKVILVLKNIKQKFRGLFEVAINIIHKIEIVKAFLSDERNRLAIRAIFHGLKQVLAHIMPRKIKGYVEFGTGDPYTMGQALTALGFIYGRYGKSIEIRPDYEEKCFETELLAKGRIRAGSLLRILWRLWRNSDIRYLRQGFVRLNEELKEEPRMAA